MIGLLKVEAKTPTKKADVLILTVFQNKVSDALPKALLTDLEKVRIKDKSTRLEFLAKAGSSISFETLGGYQHIVLLGLGKKEKLTPVGFREALADVIRESRGHKYETVDVVLNMDTVDEELGKQLGLSVYLANYSFLKYKGDKAKKKISFIKQVRFITSKNVKALEDGFERARAIATGVFLTRDLVNEPASHLGPEHMVAEARSIEKASKGAIKVKVLGEAECRKLGMGAYLGVAQGSDKEPQFIILEAGAPSKTAKRKICLIGKSIMFDSGGLSLKPSSSMEDMKIDMAGAATVLGVFKTLTEDPKLLSHVSKTVALHGIIPACENMPSGKAQRPGDVVQALNGKTIEVLNTDAEGRLALADALSYAEKYIKPDHIIDLATLTGACMVALGNDLAGLFSNDKEFKREFVVIAKSQGDPLWPLPLYKPYAKGMKSPIADLKNITGKGYGGAITAALFLQEFVDRAKWIHIDIAGPAFRNEGPRGTVPQGGTGWGVISLVEYLRRIIN